LVNYNYVHLAAGQEFDEKTLETILRESVAMKNFNHPRLVSLIGLCLGSRFNPVVILPFMINGNLRTYIKDKSKVVKSVFGQFSISNPCWWSFSFLDILAYLVSWYVWRLLYFACRSGCFSFK